MTPADPMATTHRRLQGGMDTGDPIVNAYLHGRFGGAPERSRWPELVGCFALGFLFAAAVLAAGGYLK